MISGGSGTFRLNSLEFPWYFFNKETWKTGCIFMLFGRSNLYAVTDNLSKIVYGPTYFGVNFLVGRCLSIGEIKCLVDSITWSPLSNSSWRRFLFAYLTCRS